MNRIWPPPVNHVMDFIAYLSLQSYSPSSIKLCISAISFNCKIRNLEDTTKNFIVHKMLTSLSKLNRQKDTRMPISPEILNKLLHALPSVCYSNYESFLFSSLFSIAFFGFFRVGELVQNSNISIGHALQCHNIRYVSEHNSIQIHIPFSKTDQSGRGTTLMLPAISSPTCPVKLFKSYFDIRPHFQGTFFRHINGDPVTRFQFVSLLKKALLTAGIHSNIYNSHSFRIGAATAAYSAGLDGEDIASYGRWKSNCYKSYIRIPTSNLLSI